MAKSHDNEPLGSRVRRLRGAETQSAFARRAKIPAATLRNIEQGRASDVKLTTLTRLAAALSVSVSALLDGAVLARGKVRRGRPRRKDSP